jgi:muskelin
MILDPPTSTLYIFAGQRDDKYLSDMYAFDLRTNVAIQLYADFSASGGPDACFTQRAVGDMNEREVYVCVAFSTSVMYDGKMINTMPRADFVG